MDLKGAKIILTGGSLGIGKATAAALVDRGARVVITGRNKNRLDKAAEESGGIPIVFDISNLDSIEQGAKECLKALGGSVDVLINNAGIGNFPLLGDIRAEDFENVFNTNVFGLALLTQELLPALKAANGSTIINIGSTASLKGFARGTVYAASKFAVRAITQSWQAELRRDNIRVCLVNPSEVKTAFNVDDRVEKEEESNKLNPGHIAHAIISVLEMNDVGFIPELSVWATNPY